MPTLPTLTVNDDQAARILDVFDGDPATPPADAYRAWLRAALRDKVIGHELRALADAQATQRADAIANAETALP